MITYVGTSTLLKLIIDEEGFDRAALIWQGSDSVASVSLVAVVGDLFLVEVGAELIAEASDLVETEALRGYDAVHLAAALRIGASVFTSSDSASCDAAARRGMHVANPLVV
ncbi:MAG: type II toxin-antitoxin system VapC family toxin [Actinobacteria bacterium]|nr:type II toxin-antitoxin system VapC family toxin [Actinomycetota bacterium]